MVHEESIKDQSTSIDDHGIGGDCQGPLSEHDGERWRYIELQLQGFMVFRIIILLCLLLYLLIFLLF